MTVLTAAVGGGGVNREVDVRAVQALLNRHVAALGATPLAESGLADERTLAAIRLFQSQVMRLTAPDGRVDPGGRTWLALNGTAVGAASSQLSGAAWWRANQAAFPNSAEVSALEPAFAARVTAFLGALRTAGASVEVSATRRNKIRAYLMHYSWRVAKGDVRPAEVPGEPGCSIVWNHGDDARSLRGAKEMVDLFGIVFQPSLTSRHILGLAIDMTIDWAGAVKVRNAAGNEVSLSSTSDGTNTALHGVGASYGVFKLVSDPPHWSDNGH